MSTVTLGGFMLRVVALALLAAGCGPMFDSPTAPEPTPYTVKGGGGVQFCRQVNADGTAFLPASFSKPLPTPPCPPGYQVPRD
jgi:hypothetical protein